MKILLLSIKKSYARLILNGEKTVEYRKVFPKSVDKILIYESKGRGKIIGEASIDTIFCGEPEKIWKLTNEKGGIDKEVFDSYFKNKLRAYAIVIKDIELYEQPRELSEYKLTRAPQNYCWIEK